jgi:hypothetical protein
VEGYHGIESVVFNRSGRIYKNLDGGGYTLYPIETYPKKTVLERSAAGGLELT